MPKAGAVLELPWTERIAMQAGRPIPDIIEFVTGPTWLNRPNLYPRQATLLKLIFLQDWLLTPYDYDVIGEWSEGFTLPVSGQRMSAVADLGAQETTLKYHGDWGIVPDVLDRVRILQDRRHLWFGYVLNVLGRRSGKGYLGALCAAYVLYHYVTKDDTRDFYGIDRSKRLAAQVFAGKKMQARDNQWRDIVNVIIEAPCFFPYFDVLLTDALTINSYRDKRGARNDEEARQEAIRRARLRSTMNQATFEIVPKEATTMAGRGPASFMQFYDEMAHMVSTTGGSRSAEEVWESATPSLDQFHQDAFRYCGSSPWQMVGKFYDLCQEALMVDADTLAPTYPDHLIVQLSSWDLYQDWKRTKHNMAARLAGEGRIRYECNGEMVTRTVDAKRIDFAPLKNAIQEYDHAMQQMERMNPHTFAVERRSKWAAILDQYLPTEHVRRMFHPFFGELLQQRTSGRGDIEYVMHGDPGKTGSNFGFCVAHKVEVPGSPIPHVVIDFVKGWMPQDFPNAYSLPDTPENEMDYIAIEAEIADLITNFQPTDVSLDQWNSIGMLQRLSRHAREVSYKTISVWERDATGPLNWRTAETFKIALALDLVHSPIYDLFELECTFLRKLSGDKVDHPDSGPVTTKDVYDAVSICVYKLLGADIAAAYGEQFSKLAMSPSAPGATASGPRVVGSLEASTPRSANPAARPINDVARQFSQFTRDNRSARRSRGG